MIWGGFGPLIGMVHLLALPGAPRWGGSMDAVLKRAVADALALSAAGFDGLMVENYWDVPFYRGSVPPESVAAITAAVIAVRAATPLPVGVNVLRNDALAAIGIAAATDARFVRVNVHTGSMWTDQGLVERSGHAAPAGEAGLGVRHPGRCACQARDTPSRIRDRPRRRRYLATGLGRRSWSAPGSLPITPRRF